MNFEEWRGKYDTATFDEYKRFYRGVLHERSFSRSADVAVCQRFFSSLVHNEPFDVTELGGGDGYLASQVLRVCPAVQSWTNYEMLEEFSTRQACWDERFRFRLLDRHAWEDGAMEFGNMFVCSHVIEHMKLRHVKSLLRYASAYADIVYLESPLWYLPRVWNTTGSLHLLEVGWSEIIKVCIEFGYRKVAQVSPYSFAFLKK